MSKKKLPSLLGRIQGGGGGGGGGGGIDEQKGRETWPTLTHLHPQMFLALGY